MLMLHAWTCRDCRTDLLVYTEVEPDEINEEMEVHLRRLATRNQQVLVDTRGVAEPGCPHCGSRYGFDGHFEPPFECFELARTSKAQCGCGMPLRVYFPAFSSNSPELLEALRREAEAEGAVLVNPDQVERKSCPRCGVYWDFRLSGITVRED